MKMADYKISEAIVKGNLELCVADTNRALTAGVAPQEIINNFLIKGMEEIGQAFQDGKAFVPNLLMSARAMKGSLEILKPLLKVDGKEQAGQIVIGTVKGDLHDIGKNLVASMLEGCGFNVINLGVDVSSEKFINAVKENNANIICLSALLTTTMTYMEQVVKDLTDAGLRDKVKIMIGGAPVNKEFADKIGADGYSDNANAAVLLAHALLETA